MNKIRPIYLYICLTLAILAGLAFFVLDPITATAADEIDSGSSVYYQKKE